MAEQRECPICPPWVRCAHFNGQILWLSDRALAKHLYLRNASQRYCVRLGFRVASCGPLPNHSGSICKADCNMPVLVAHSDTSFRTDFLPAAEDEFRRREEILLST